MTLPLKNIENVGKEKGFFYGYSGLVIVVRGREELFFEFSQVESRDDCAVMLLKNLPSAGHLLESGTLNSEESRAVEEAELESRSSQDSHQEPSDQYQQRFPETEDTTCKPLRPARYVGAGDSDRF